MSSFDLTTCDIEAFVAEVTPQPGSLEEAASTQEILIQQIEGYLNRLKEAICTDLTSIQTNCCDSGGVDTFLELTDTPAAYAGAAGDVATVNAGATALEFTTPAAGALPDLVDNVEITSGREVDGNATFFKLRDIGALPNNATTTTAHNIGAAFALVQAYGIANDPSSPFGLPIVFSTTTFLTNTVYFFTDATNINVTTGSNRTGFTNNYVVLEYYYL